MKRASSKLRPAIFGIALLITGCSFSFQKWQYQKALREADKHHYKNAANQLARVVRRGPKTALALEAARRGSKIASFDTKNYALASEFYRQLILHSPDKTERIEAQKALVDIHFDKSLNYDEAVLEISRLQPLLPDAEKGQYQLLLARAQFNLNNFSQALIEINDLISRQIKRELRFEALLFKANLLQGSKKLPEAIAVFLDLEKNYAGLSSDANVGMSLAICYEEQGDLGKAVSVLENLKLHHASPDFIQIRINKLKDRMANLPGAQGLQR